ncbi:MAG TPA: hypothetical protein DEP84_33845 [Chloroflexi bacterium]|nr:hypothetical protein [Chloroflexota bacterium]
MPRISSEAERQRRERIWIAVQRHPQGITEAEVADFVGVERRTVNNYLNKLEAEGKIYKDGTLWCPLNYEGTRLRAFELSPEEALTLYLATRLLVKLHDKRNEPAETALLKLATVLTGDAGVGYEIEQAAHELMERPVQSGYSSVFRTMMQAYIYRRRVAIRYKPLNGKAFETTFAPYLFEPSSVGFATYTIGHSSLPDKLRSYKLERIESARLTREEYTIPADFPGLDILRHAWSVIFGDELVRVVLRFSPRVRERVLETRWHPSQTTANDPEKGGWLRWAAHVADTTDMLPWIRGWGADVEVLAPTELRDMMSGETRRLAERYGWLTSRAAEARDTLDQTFSDYFGG